MASAEACATIGAPDEEGGMSVSQYRIEIDASLCSGFGSCSDTAPDTFALGDDGIAFVREGGGDAGVIEAAQGCPMGSIAVFDKETGEQLA